MLAGYGVYKGFFANDGLTDPWDDHERIVKVKTLLIYCWNTTCYSNSTYLNYILLARLNRDKAFSCKTAREYLVCRQVELP